LNTVRLVLPEQAAIKNHRDRQSLPPSGALSLSLGFPGGMTGAGGGGGGCDGEQSLSDAAVAIFFFGGITFGVSGFLPGAGMGSS